MPKTLVLNKNYFPIRLASKYSAIGKFYCQMAEAIIVKDGNYLSYSWDEWLKLSEKDNWPEDTIFLHSTNNRIALPYILRCLHYTGVPKVSLRLTRKAIYERDEHICYLCGKEFTEGHLTLDHIIPRSRGGQSTWENLATCCKECNTEKGDKLLSEMHKKPKFTAYRPSTSNIAKLKLSIPEGCYREEWKVFGV